MKISKKFPSLLALSLLSSPFAVTANIPTETKPSLEKVSPRAATRRMKHQLASAPAYIRPPEANHIDAPLSNTYSSDEIVGIYGNILYPQDLEKAQLKKLADWLATAEENRAFPFSAEEMKDLSIYRLNQFPSRSLRFCFAQNVAASLQKGLSLELSLEKGKEAAFARALAYKEKIGAIPQETGQGEILIAKMNESIDQIEKRVEKDINEIQKNPKALQDLLTQMENDLIESPFDWETRTNVFKQMIDKTIAHSPNSPYFLALQEVTPQALDDLKKGLAERNLQWISFNNISGKETLAPRSEAVLGEATAFTSTIALSKDLEVLKVALGDLPTESGSVRKVLGVRVKNIHNGEVFNLFSTHTDHFIRNEIYERTALKLHAFATQFFEDAALNERRFVLGGDLNVFEQLNGAQYVEKIRELFVGSQDFRETDYYAPHPIAWSSFIGRFDDEYSARIATDGTVEPSGLDQIVVGNGIELQAAMREAGVYDESGHLLDYYTDREKYMANLEKRITFSDHFFNVVRFR